MKEFLLTSYLFSAKKLITKKVLETPGAKLLNRFQINNSKSTNQSVLPMCTDERVKQKVSETPFNKMPKSFTSHEGMKLRNRLRSSIGGESNLSQNSTEGSGSSLKRRDSFYKPKEHSAEKSILVAKTSSSNSIHRQSFDLNMKSKIAEDDKLKAESVRSYNNDLTPDDQKSVKGFEFSPYSIIFKPNENGKVSELIFTPAKSEMNFDDCKSIDSDGVDASDTPLRGIFPIQKSGGKNIQAIHGVETLSLIDTKVSECFTSDKENQPLNDHLTRSTTKIHQFRNVKMTSASKEKPTHNVRKSLFAKKSSAAASPKKFRAQSSFHDDKPTTIYKIFCEDSLSMDFLSELVKEKELEDEKVKQSMDMDEDRTGYSGDLGFKLRKKLPLVNDSPEYEIKGIDLCSPSPVNHKFSSNSILNSQRGDNYSSQTSRSSGNSKCGNLSKALDELLKNPIKSPDFSTAPPA